jgi:hypothetical protein
MARALAASATAVLENPGPGRGAAARLTGGAA